MENEAKKPKEKKLRKPKTKKSKKRDFEEIKQEEKKIQENASSSEEEIEPSSVKEDEEEIYMSDDFEFLDEGEDDNDFDFSSEEDIEEDDVKSKVISVVDESEGPKVKNEVTKAPLFKDVEDDDDESEDEADINKIGKVPLKWYEEYDHIGYTLDGKKIMRKKQGDSLDNLVASHDDPNYLRKVYDEKNDREYVLTNDDFNVILSIEKGQFPPGYEPYQDYVDWLEYDSRFPLHGTHEPKRNFQPDKGEHKKIVEIMRKMKNGQYKSEQQVVKHKPMYLMWGEDNNLIDGEKVQTRKTLKAPKISLPGHRRSYNPPEEYGTKIYSSLREVPVDPNFILDRYNRCLDLYLAPRHEITKRKLINPEALLPELPKPEELRPFPEILSVIYEGHEHIVRSISVDPTGKWLVSASDDETVRLWEVDTGRCTRIWRFTGCDIGNVEWNPNPEVNVFGVTVDNLVYLIQPKETANEEVNIKTSLLFPEEDEESLEIDIESRTKTDRKKVLLKWQYKTEKSLREQGIVLTLEHLKKVTQITWHPKGDYFATLSPEAYNDGIIIHQLTKAQSQKPFKKSQRFKGVKLTSLKFHPNKPLFIVVTQISVKIYNLVQQKLHKKLKGKTSWFSSVAIHPSGDHLISGGYDRKLEWFDIEISATSFKTFKYHSKAVRSVAFHQTYPLFATCSDDGYIRVFHCTVFDDWLKDPMIVPVKILKAHKRTSELGILDLKFHPTQPWLFTSGADQSIRLFSS
eukprot:gene3136-5452_t